LALYPRHDLGGALHCFCLPPGTENPSYATDQMDGHDRHPTFRECVNYFCVSDVRAWWEQRRVENNKELFFGQCTSSVSRKVHAGLDNSLKYGSPVSHAANNTSCCVTELQLLAGCKDISLFGGFALIIILSLRRVTYFVVKVTADKLHISSQSATSISKQRYRPFTTVPQTRTAISPRRGNDDETSDRDQKWSKWREVDAIMQDNADYVVDMEMHSKWTLQVISRERQRKSCISLLELCYVLAAYGEFAGGFKRSYMCYDVIMAFSTPIHYCDV